MPMTVEEYHQRWQKAMEPGSREEEKPWDKQNITRTSSIFFEREVHGHVGDEMSGWFILSDFGAAICYFRYRELRHEFGSDDTLLSSHGLTRKETVQHE